MRPEPATRQLEQVLSREMKHPDNAGIDTLIWSNEWLFERPDRVLPALKLLEKQGVDVEIILYVRGHDRWITSSYVQWGIKNKTYPGPIRDFGTWLKGRNFSYESIAKPWLDAFGSKVAVLNFDAAGDVVQHFFGRLGVPANASKRVNVSPSADKLAAWAVFNNRIQDAVPENLFGSWLKRLGRDKSTARDVPDLASLLPTPEDVARLDTQYSADRAFVNNLLRGSGEPEFQIGGEVEPPTAPTGWEMDRLLLEMVFHLQARIAVLEKERREGND